MLQRYLDDKKPYRERKFQRWWGISALNRSLPNISVPAYTPYLTLSQPQVSHAVHQSNKTHQRHDFSCHLAAALKRKRSRRQSPWPRIHITIFSSRGFLGWNGWMTGRWGRPDESSEEYIRSTEYKAEELWQLLQGYLPHSSGLNLLSGGIVRKRSLDFGTTQFHKYVADAKSRQSCCASDKQKNSVRVAWWGRGNSWNFIKKDASILLLLQSSHGSCAMGFLLYLLFGGRMKGLYRALRCVDKDSSSW